MINIAGMWITMEDGDVLGRKNHVAGQGVAQASRHDGSPFRVARESTGDFLADDELHECDVLGRDRKYLRHDHLVATLIVLSSANEVLLLVDDVDFISEGLPDVLKHFDQGHRAELIKIVICSEKPGESINDSKILRQIRENVRFDNFANRLPSRCSSGRNVRRTNRRSNTCFGENLIRKLDLIFVDRGLTDILSDELSQFLSSHRVNIVFQILERFPIVGSKVRIPGEDLSNLLEAGHFGDEFFEIVATRCTWRKKGQADKLIHETIIRKMV